MQALRDRRRGRRVRGHPDLASRASATRTPRSSTTSSTCSGSTARTSASRPLRERKVLLKNALNFQDHVRLTAYRNEAGEAMFAEACAKGWEGVIAKRADSLYTDKRSKDWLKFKCEHGQELVIGGFTAPRGSREEFGALLVGHFADGELRYAGKVGTGFDRETLKDLGARMRELTRDTTPFADSPELPRRHLDRAGARRPVRLRRVDHRGPPAPPEVPRPAHRQGRGRRRPRALNAEARLEAGFGHQKIRQVWSGDIVTRSQPSGRLRCLTSPVSAGGRSGVDVEIERASAAGQLDG